MADIINAAKALVVGKKLTGQRPTFRVIENQKGYIVVGNGVKNLPMLMLQGMALTSGACFLAASIGLLAMPTIMDDGLGFIVRGSAAVIFAGLAAYMLWFSSRGSKPEVQINTRKGEIREAIRNRAGKTTVLRSYGFDAIGGVFIDRTFGGPKDALLVLRYKNTPQTLSVAQGSIYSIEKLKDRIGQDLLRGASPAQPKRVVPRRVQLAA